MKKNPVWLIRVLACILRGKMSRFFHLIHNSTRITVSTAFLDSKWYQMVVHYIIILLIQDLFVLTEPSLLHLLPLSLPDHHRIPIPFLGTIMTFFVRENSIRADKTHRLESYRKSLYEKSSINCCHQILERSS